MSDIVLHDDGVDVITLKDDGWVTAYRRDGRGDIHLMASGQWDPGQWRWVFTQAHGSPTGERCHEFEEFQ